MVLTDMIPKVVIGVIVVVLIGLTILIIAGYLYKQPLGAVFIDTAGGGAKKKVCQNTQVHCENDSDCATICKDDVQMTCQTLTRNSQDQEQKYGASGNYCLPALPSKPCNAKNGGIWVWTGWASPDRMEWDCLCTWPDYYGDIGCTDLNPGICSPGTFTYNASGNTNPPLAQNCKCDPGNYLMIRLKDQSPFCVNNNIYPDYFSESCVATNDVYPKTCP